MRKLPVIWLALGLLAAMAALMIGPARQDSATVDETGHLSFGYIAWKGWPTRMGADEHPPLGQMLEALPLTFRDVKKFPPPPRWCRSGRGRRSPLVRVAG